MPIPTTDIAPADPDPAAPAEMRATDLVAAAEDAAARLEAARDAIRSVIFGQEAVIDQSLIGVLSGGHVLLVGLPGLAKTRLVETLGTVLGLGTRRVQCTPDLMPADILGSEVLEEDPATGRRSFRFVAGPIFTQLLMADEINRASPRTQSALLQAMQERRVTIAGQDRALPAPFHVLATQNPIEQEGTYPLPEAQLDRFLMQIDVGFPDRDAERRMLIATTGAEQPAVPAILSARELGKVQHLIRRLPVGEQVVEAILTLVRGARPDAEGDPALRGLLAWGPGPRASQALMLACRARALLDGRLAPSIDDIAALAAPVLRHRMAPTLAARAAGTDADTLVARLVERLG